MSRLRLSRRWLSVLSPVVVLLLWEVLVQLGVLNRRFFPQPSRIIETLYTLAQSGQLWNELGISTLRIISGFLIGALLGIFLGLLIGISQTASAILRPLITAINPIPKIALIPFVVLALGFTEWARVLSMAISVMPIMLLDTAAAVGRIDPTYFEVAKSYRASRWAVFWTVALPASLPSIMNSVKLGLSYSLTLIIGVELFGAQQGIGKFIWDSANLYAVNKLGAGIVAIAITGWLITALIDLITPSLIPWQPRPVEAALEESPVQRALRIWWRAARPWSYTAATVPALLGTVIAAYQGHFNLAHAVLVVVGSVALQAGTNLINDYYDHRKGADTEKSLGVGGAIQRGELTPRQVFWGGIAAFGLGSLIGLYFVSQYGAFILALGLLSVLAGFFYTAGPSALAYIGLGEITVFVFMGPVIVVGAYVVQAGQISWEALIASLPIGFLVAAILHANNLRDLEQDRAIGKRTLATILGRERATIEYYILVGGTYVALAISVLVGGAPLSALLGMLTLPMAWGLMQRVSVTSEPAALNPILRKTAQLHARFGMLLVGGWLIALCLALLNKS
ncbi:MAG TPA: 1,4-dihydroxy-2-naphthoate octaprenyltransferase [Aggregatilineales bacterium]|nr:1,4-dihydroxy-2-naphthoate octaprenyltransferase [Anaerolineales bacterium]HRE49026.1 1,4-dihydroxy-2-naphthoate octaprenyltransferase [Aggregatilineales bacterium]